MALSNHPHKLASMQHELLQRIVFLLNSIFLTSETLKKDKGILEMKKYLLIPSSLSDCSKLEKFKDIAKRNSSSPLLFTVQEKHVIQNFYGILKEMKCTTIEDINSSIAKLNMQFPHKTKPDAS